MAAAEYYNTSINMTAPSHAPHQQSPYQQSPQHQSPYQQSPYQRPQELHGSPIPQYALHPVQQSPQPTPPPPPPPYSSSQPDLKPSVHFAPSPVPSQQHRPSVSSSGRPSFSNQSPPRHGQYLQPPSAHEPRPQNGALSRPVHAAVQPPHMRPYMNGNQSEIALGGGYASDPEDRRRRRHRRRESKDDESSSRDIRPRKDRSRSTNTDGFLGAAGGGLIGDLIFPGLGTVGGAVVGWIGGKDYGKHRKGREEKLHKEQKEWEHEFRDRSHSGDRRHDHDRHHHGHRRSPPRHKDGHY